MSKALPQALQRSLPVAGSGLDWYACASRALSMAAGGCTVGPSGQHGTPWTGLLLVWGSWGLLVASRSLETHELGVPLLNAADCACAGTPAVLLLPLLRGGLQQHVGGGW